MLFAHENEKCYKEIFMKKTIFNTTSKSIRE